MCKRKRESRLYSVVASISLVFAVWIGCAVRESDDPALAGPPEPQASRFVARLITVSSGPFVDHLHECYLPAWKSLHEDGLVLAVSVFELEHYDKSMSRLSAQDFLVLAQLAPVATPADLADAEIASDCAEREGAPAFSVLRAALMSCTPNACHGSPEPAYPDAASGIDFLVEFIGVEETPAALAKYREIMSEYAGPANGILVERGMLHCFVGLERVDILSSGPSAVPWNQIHISDDWDEGGDVDWESVYSELFLNEFLQSLDSVWAELPPTDERRTDYRGRLLPGLCVR